MNMHRIPPHLFSSPSFSDLGIFVILPPPPIKAVNFLMSPFYVQIYILYMDIEMKQATIKRLTSFSYWHTANYK